MLSFFKKNIEEIAQSRALTVYGACLAAVHILTFHQWRQFGRVLLDRNDPICWPFAIDCHWMRVWSETGLQIFFVAYLLLAVIGVLLFFLRKPAFAYVSLSALTAMKFFLTIQDYRFAGNYHYMPNIITLLFLFAPGKEEILRLMLVAFYVAAGFLKLNREWLSGAAMISPPVISGIWLKGACAYAVFFELVVVWGMLSRKFWMRTVAFAHAIVFHAFSWHIVGYFYPSVMGLLLAIFPMLWTEKTADETDLKNFFAGRLRLSHYLIIVAFSGLQLVPRVLSYDPAVTGEGRILALNMFDAYTECRFEMVQKYNGTVSALTWKPRIGVRVQCDPIVYYNYARNRCRGREGFELDISLVSKRKTDTEYKPVFFIENFCTQRPDYRWLGANSWIKGDK